MQSFAIMFDDTMEVLKGAVKAFIEPAADVLNFFSNFYFGVVFISVVFTALLIFCVLKTDKPFSRFKQPRCLVICAMLTAANAVLGYFSINFSSYLRVGFGFITTPIASYLFGPCVGGAVAAASDVAALIIKPTGGWLFTYTMGQAVEGMIYGLFLYRKKISFVRVFMCRLMGIILVNIILNSIAVAPTAASGLIGIFPARVIKNLILLPIQSFIIYEVLKRTVEGRVKC